MSGIIANYNQEVQEINRNLNILKKSGASYQNILDTISELRERFTETMVDIRMKKDNLLNFKDEKIKKVEKVQMIVKEKDAKIKNLTDQVEQYTNVSKKVISEINFKKLKKVKREQSIENLWRFFYTVLYYEPENTFDYNQFVKIALNKNIDDFQARLANFKILKLDREHREKIRDLKTLNYPTNNDDFNFFLEWIDYNYEAYLLLKQVDELEREKGAYQSSDKKYQRLIENSQYVENEQNQILELIEYYLDQLKFFEDKIKQADRMKNQNSELKRLDSNVEKLFKKIERFEGNKLAEDVDQMGF